MIQEVEGLISHRVVLGCGVNSAAQLCKNFWQYDEASCLVAGCSVQLHDAAEELRSSPVKSGQQKQQINFEEERPRWTHEP